MLSPIPLHIHFPPTLRPNIPRVLFPRGGTFPPPLWVRGGDTYDWCAAVPTLFVFVLNATCSIVHRERPHTRPHTLTTPLHATTLHSHLLPANTPAPHSHLYFGYKLPLWHVPLGLASVAAKDRAPLHIHSRLGKYTKEPWLYPPPPLSKERSSVGRAQAPHRLASRCSPFSIHSSNCLCCIV